MRVIMVDDGEKVKARPAAVDRGTRTVTPILAEKAGIVQLRGHRRRRDRPRRGRAQGPGGPAGRHRAQGREASADHHRRTATARSSTSTTCRPRPVSKWTKARRSQAGQLLARQPREAGGTQDITGGLPRVTEIFEARKPKDPAAMAEISGTVELQSDKRRGKMTIIVRSETGMEKEHHVPQDKHLQVHTGDYVEAGDPLTDGPLVPHDILRIKGEEALQRVPADEVQNVYRAQSVKINDKHIEIILTQMLRKVKIENVGDSEFLPGEVVDKFRFRQANDELGAQRSKITDAGRHDARRQASLSTKEELEAANEKAEGWAASRPRARSRVRHGQDAAAGHHQGIAAAESFISAASFQETTKVLTEAASGW